MDFGTTRKLRVCMYKKKQQTEREENRAKRRSEKKWEVENRPFVRLGSVIGPFRKIWLPR